jgi:hypothetical protein
MGQFSIRLRSSYETRLLVPDAALMRRHLPSLQLLPPLSYTVSLSLAILAARSSTSTLQETTLLSTLTTFGEVFEE